MVRKARIAALAAALSLVGCRSEAPAAPSAEAGAELSSAAAPPPDPAPTVSPRAADPVWLRGDDDDPLEHARLAEAVGAAALLEGVEDGGQLADAALAALPFAEDGDLALGPLTDWARLSAGRPARKGTTGAPAPSVSALLSAALEIAGKPRKQRERLDPEGEKRAAETALALAHDARLDPADRALSLSLARALTERGLVDPKLVDMAEPPSQP